MRPFWIALGLMVIAQAAAAETRLLVLGDSLTAGYGLPEGQAFPAQLERRLKADGLSVRVFNGGVSGDTSQGGLNRLDWALADKPDAVIVELGANDALRALDPKATEANLDALLARLKAAEVKTLLAGMLAPPNLGESYGAEFNAIYPRLAKKHGAALYPFFLDGVAGQPALNQPDAIHPTTAGVAVIVERILPMVKDLVRR